MEDIANHFSVNYFGGIIRSCGRPRTMPEKSGHGPTVPIVKALCAVRLSAASQLFYLIDVANRITSPSTHRSLNFAKPECTLGIQPNIRLAQSAVREGFALAQYISTRFWSKCRMRLNFQKQTPKKILRGPPPHLAIQPFSASWVASISSSLYRRRGQKKPRKPSPLRRGTMWT